MKLTSDSETLAENKVLILYILSKVGKAISNDALLNLVLKVTDMNYFYFQQFLLDLIDNKYIMSFHKDNKSFYDITKLGLETLQLTQDIIPGIIKLRVDSNFKTEIDNFANEHSIIAEYIPKSENDYTVTCKMIDNNETIFELKTFAGSRTQAKEIADNWKNNAESIYPKIIDVITKKN